MDAKLTEVIRKNSVFEPAALATVISVETSGKGFDSTTGKLIIRFEKSYFSRISFKSKVGIWARGIQRNQDDSWEQFNDAFTKDPNAAMRSTSIGLGQIMGDNYKELGYSSVGAMWEDAKKGLTQQLDQMIKFIKSKPALIKSIKTHDWATFATYYNGPNYKVNHYDTKLASTYAVLSKTIK